MKELAITNHTLNAFRDHLLREEKSPATVEKYMRDTHCFLEFLAGRVISKDETVAFKQNLQDKGYAIRSINSMLASLNHFLEFLDCPECKVRHMRVQRQVYCTEDKELTKTEYMRLLEASGKNTKLNLILQTICGTGIRVSELKYFTVEAVNSGEITVCCKNKTRTILVPGKLRKLLTAYAKKAGIKCGVIFVGKNGKPMDRSAIWAQMKRLCAMAKVNPTKVFPHNLRKLFARTFYTLEKDIAKLADILGHGSIETTRIYIMTTSGEHRRKIERLGLVI